MKTSLLFTIAILLPPSCGLRVKTAKSSVIFGGDVAYAEVRETPTTLTVRAWDARYSPVARERWKGVTSSLDRVVVGSAGAMVMP